MASQAPREELLALVSRINTAAEGLDTAEANGVSDARQKLLLESQRLIASLGDPDAEVWPRAFQINVAVSIDIAATLGIWEKLRRKNLVTLSEVMENTAVDAATTGLSPLNTNPQQIIGSLTPRYRSPNLAATDRSWTSF